MLSLADLLLYVKLYWGCSFLVDYIRKSYIIN